MCPEAFQQQLDPIVTEIELVGRGSRIRVPTKKRAKPNRKHQGNVQRQQLNRKAKINARKRLAAMFPDLYDMLVADERQQLGLDPYPRESSMKRHSPEVDIRFAQLFAELQNCEVDTE